MITQQFEENNMLKHYTIVMKKAISLVIMVLGVIRYSAAGDVPFSITDTTPPLTHQENHLAHLENSQKVFRMDQALAMPVGVFSAYLFWEHMFPYAIEHPKEFLKDAAPFVLAFFIAIYCGDIEVGSYLCPFYSSFISTTAYLIYRDSDFTP